jgi:hypothetical protein
VRWPMPVAAPVTRMTDFMMCVFQKSELKN